MVISRRNFVKASFFFANAITAYQKSSIAPTLLYKSSELPNYNFNSTIVPRSTHKKNFIEDSNCDSQQKKTVTYLTTEKTLGNGYVSYNRETLQKTKDKLSDSKIIICEPFVLPHILTYYSIQSAIDA